MKQKFMASQVLSVGLALMAGFAVNATAQVEEGPEAKAQAFVAQAQALHSPRISPDLFRRLVAKMASIPGKNVTELPMRKVEIDGTYTAEVHLTHYHAERHEIPHVDRRVDFYEVSADIFPTVPLTLPLIVAESGKADEAKRPEYTLHFSLHNDGGIEGAIESAELRGVPYAYPIDSPSPAFVAEVENLIEKTIK